MGCQKSFPLQVLNSTPEISPDHAIQLCEFWSLPDAEADYFIDLVHLARAGSKVRQRYLMRRIKKNPKRREWSLRRNFSGRKLRTPTFRPCSTRLGIGRPSRSWQSAAAIPAWLNWRHRAIQSLQSQVREALHYTSVISISESDFHRIKAMIVSQVKDQLAVVRNSPAEDAYCLSLDFFTYEKSVTRRVLVSKIN